MVSLSKIDSVQRKLVLRGLSDGTIRAYTSPWRQFVSFCSNHGLKSFPASSSNVLRYVTFLHLSKRSASTLKVTLAAIRTVHLLYFNFDPSDTYHIRLALKGHSRICPTLPDKRIGMTDLTFKRIIGYIPLITSSSFESILFTAVLSFLFHGWLRIGEVLSTSKTRPDARLQLRGLQISNKYVTICLKFDKTSNGSNRLCKLLSSTLVCPCQSIRDFMVIRPFSSINAPLFIHVDGSPLTVGQFRLVWKKIVLDLNLPNTLTPHSFRMSGASRAVAAGLSSTEIRRTGRWASNSSVYLKYIRPRL